MSKSKCISESLFVPGYHVLSLIGAIQAPEKYRVWEIFWGESEFAPGLDQKKDGGWPDFITLREAVSFNVADS